MVKKKSKKAGRKGRSSGKKGRRASRKGKDSKVRKLMRLASGKKSKWKNGKKR